jgi:photosystem II stability/assembly factor-like uncharacterized protein
VDNSTHRIAWGAGALTALFLTLTALLLPSAALAADAPWAPQTSGTTQPLYGVSFVNENAGWAVGGGGSILSTTNGGETWKAQASRTTQTLNAVVFVDAATGWAVGSGGTILRTTDGGSTWAAQKSGITQPLHAVAFASATTGWAVGGRGTVLRTTNGGATWTAQPSGTTQALNGVACADASTCWAVGNKGTVRRSTNAGATWAGQPTGVKTTLYAVGCSDAATAWIAGNGGLIRKTTNGGGAWVPQTSGTTQTLRALTVIDASRVRVAGSSGTVRVTVNGGSLWAAESTNNTQTLYGIAWRGVSGWVVGGGGTILADRPDRSPPVTTATGLQPDNLSGWTNAAVTVTLSAADGGNAGVAATYYTVDDGTAQTYTAAFTVSGVNQHMVTYWSVDKVGNIEDARTGWVNISDPYAQADGLAADQNSGWHNGSVTVTITARGKPGPLSVWYQLDGGSWLEGSSLVVSGAGHHTVNFYAKNGNGIESVHQTGYVNIDLTKPVTTLKGTAPKKWVSKPVTLSYSATDDASGVAATYTSVDGAADVAGLTFVLPAPADHTFDGPHTVAYWSTDAAGNAESPTTLTISVDTRKPTVRAPYAASAVHGRTAKLRFTVKDTAPCAGTAAAKIVVKNARGRAVKTLKKTVKAGIASTASFRCKLAKGKYRFFVYATDPAGNKQVKVASNRLTVR